MKKLFAGSLIATLLAASAAFAADRPSSPPVRGTEGPDTRATQSGQFAQPVKGTEGPGNR